MCCIGGWSCCWDGIWKRRYDLCSTNCAVWVYRCLFLIFAVTSEVSIFLFCLVTRSISLSSCWTFRLILPTRLHILLPLNLSPRILSSTCPILLEHNHIPAPRTVHHKALVLALINHSNHPTPPPVCLPPPIFTPQLTQ